MNNQIWIMTSALAGQSFEQVLERADKVGAQGLELCVFRRDGARQDHVATHLDYEEFGPADAQKVIDAMNAKKFKFSIGAYENLIGGDPEERIKNQNHLLTLIRMAALMGGDENDVKVGTFVGYNNELGWQDNGFQKNLDEYKKVFEPIVKYAEDLGVTIIYENCPMEGWYPKSTPTTFNNLPGTLAARKLMYAMIPSKAHGETYDPSHDIWQNIEPVDVIKHTDMSRVHRVHVKATRINYDSPARIHWGGLYPMQDVDPALAEKAGVPIPAHEWDRHHYEPMLPGFGGYDSMDWREFVTTVLDTGYTGPFNIENEGDNSSHTGNLGATLQGFHATILNLAPMLWPLVDGEGYAYDQKDNPPLKDARKDNVPVVTMADL